MIQYILETEPCDITYLPAGMEGFAKQLIIQLTAAAVLIYILLISISVVTIVTRFHI